MISKKECFEMCPYLRAMQKESRRNAVIRDRDRRTDEDFKDIYTEEPVLSRVKAHISQREDRKTKAKWVSLAADYAVEIAISGPMEKDAMRKYLQMARENAEAMARKKKRARKERDWVRTNKLLLDGDAWKTRT